MAIAASREGHLKRSKWVEIAVGCVSLERCYDSAIETKHGMATPSGNAEELTDLGTMRNGRSAVAIVTTSWGVLISGYLYFVLCFITQ